MCKDRTGQFLRPAERLIGIGAGSKQLSDSAGFGYRSALTPTPAHAAGGEHTEGCGGQGGDPADQDRGADPDGVGDLPEERSADRCGTHEENGLERKGRARSCGSVRIWAMAVVAVM